MSNLIVNYFLPFLIALVFLVSGDAMGSERDMVVLPNPSHLFMEDVNGQKVEWPEQEEFRVFCFLGVECPVARFYAARLNELENQFSNKHVSFVGINSNPHDSVADLRNFTKELKLNFRQIKDTDQSIAKAFGASRTAEVVVVDRNGNIHYRGRIDDQYTPGVKRASPNRYDLKNALLSLLGHQPVAIQQTEPVGCLITFEKRPEAGIELTYCKHIAPILYQHCLECHRPNDIGPFDISNFEELRGWANMIVEVMEQKRMPPWHANETKHPFKNARHMPSESIEQIKRWVNAGAPYGDAQDLPSKPEFLEGWRLPRSPDLVVEMRDRPYTVPSEGTVDYQYFVVDPKISDDRWMSAAQVIPGNASVVHHAIVFVRPPDGVDSMGVGWLTAYVPGQRATMFPPGYARRVPAGSKFVFQMHYTPNGKEQFDTTKIGINFVESDQVTHEVFTLVGLDQELEIPPHVSNHQVEASLRWFPRDGELLAVMPHMHLRGKSFRLTAQSRSQDSTTALAETLLDVPNYDFNWQHTYEFQTPLALRTVQGLNFEVGFDNSSNNPFNPNPNEYVMWGDQTWEEMAVAFLEVARPIHSNPTVTSESAAVSEETSIADKQPSTTADEKAVSFAEKLLAKFDRNRDERLTREEVSQIVRDYSFHKLDSNRDGVVTKEELMQASRNSRD